MRTLIVGHTYLASENRKKLTQLAEILGGPVDVLSPSRAADQLFEFNVTDQHCSGPGFRITFASTWPRRLGHARSAIAGLRGILDRVRPDVIQVEMAPWTIPALQLITARRLGMVKAAMVGLIRQPILRRKWRSGWRLKSWAARTACRQFDLIITATEAARTGVFDRLFGSGADVPSSRTVYPLGVDTDLFRPATVDQRARLRKALGLAEADILIGYCGRLVEEKGLVDLMGAVASLPGRDAGAGPVVGVLGDGPLRENLARLATERGIRLIQLAKVPHASVAEFLCGLDIFVLPARVTDEWVEHDAHVVVEALACGVPVLGSTSGPIPEILSGVGPVFAAGDVNDLSGHLRRLVASTDARAELGRAGRRRAVDSYSHRRVAEMTADAWRLALEQYRVARPVSG